MVGDVHSVLIKSSWRLPCYLRFFDKNVGKSIYNPLKSSNTSNTPHSFLLFNLVRLTDSCTSIKRELKRKH